NEPAFYRVHITGRDGEEPRVRRQDPHPPRVVAEVRHLVETTALPYRVIAERTGVDNGTISRWARARAWVRPPYACRGRPRRDGEGELTGRALARKAYVQAERLLVAVTSAPHVDPAALREALALLREAREAQRVRR